MDSTGLKEGSGTDSFKRLLSFSVLALLSGSFFLVLFCTYFPYSYTILPSLPQVHPYNITAPRENISFTSNFTKPVDNTSFISNFTKTTEDTSFLSNLTKLAKNTSFSTEELKNLYEVLDRASMKESRTVILAPLNKAWSEKGSIFDVFLQSFREGQGTSYLLNHLVVIAFDEGAFEKCTQVHTHCFSLKTPGVNFSQEQPYMSKDFNYMSKRRVYFQIVVLQLGFDFIFTDADILWFRPPFVHFSKDADFQISCDNFVGNSSSLRNAPNTGFYHVRSNLQTIALLKHWDRMNNAYPRKKDQDIFNKMRKASDFAKMGVTLKFMPTLYFGGLCQKSGDMEKVCTMHVNCCIGIRAKLADMKLMLNDWKRFQSMTPQESRERHIHFRAPRHCPRS